MERTEIGGAMFETVVVALDLTDDGDRALPAVEALTAGVSVRIDLVTVSEPRMPAAADAFELERRTRRHGWDRNAWTIVRDVDPAAGLVAHAAARPGTLLVMATSAKRPISSSLLGSVTCDVLAATRQPVLLIGPGASPDAAHRSSSLIVGVGRDPIDPLTVPTVASWHATFGGPPPLLVDVVGPSDDQVAARARLDGIRAELAARCVESSTRLVVADDPVRGLEEVVAGADDPVIVACSARYTDGRLHWHSTTQRLAAGATCPILVVPARFETSPMPLTPAAAEVADRRAFHDRTTPPGAVESARDDVPAPATA
jgi:nucleotide-binding universal stress UspA family protein